MLPPRGCCGDAVGCCKSKPATLRTVTLIDTNLDLSHVTTIFLPANFLVKGRKRLANFKSFLHCSSFLLKPLHSSSFLLIPPHFLIIPHHSSSFLIIPHHNAQEEEKWHHSC